MNSSTQTNVETASLILPIEVDLNEYLSRLSRTLPPTLAESVRSMRGSTDVIDRFADALSKSKVLADAVKELNGDDGVANVSWTHLTNHSDPLRNAMENVAARSIQSDFDLQT